MASPLIRKAYALNQAINDHVSSFPLRYDKANNIWDFKTNKTNKLYYIHIVLYVGMLFFTIFLALVLLYLISYRPGIFTVQKTIALGVLFLATFNVVINDLMVFIFGHDIAFHSSATINLQQYWTTGCNISTKLAK